LHTADLPYENLLPAKWLPRYYETVKVLNEAVGRELSDFFGPEIAGAATELIKSLNDEIIGAVKSKIAAHKKVFQSKPQEEQQKLEEAARLAIVHPGLGTVARACPACGSSGALDGTKVKEFKEEYKDGELLVDVQFLASAFKCPACGLALKGVEEIAHAGVDTHFVEATSTSLHDLYEPEHYQEYNNM
jgi:predicted RNA-binding Zn-ribbon protein involved in translation (DUF1610 family)